jgi:hypothetical protein
LSDPFHTIDRASFAGVPASQIWADFLLWELVLNAHPSLDSIFELGTGQGGFSRYLWAQASSRSMTFKTWDAAVPVDPPFGFNQADVFRDSEWIAGEIVQAGPSILFCDNGDKKRELRTYAPYLEPGEVVVVHDWLAEIGPDDVPESLVPIHEDLCDELGSMSRVFTPEGSW